MLHFLSVRYRKAVRDLWLNKTRSVLVIIAIAIGLFGIGTILSAFSILTREMDANYLSTNPPSAILTVDNLDEAALDGVRGFSFVDQVEARRTVTGRIQVGEDEWRIIYLYVIDDFDELQVSTFSHEEGAVKPQTGEILLERSSQPVQEGDLDVGDVATIRTPNGGEAQLPIVGINFNPAQPPGWMDGVAYGYIGLDTLPMFEMSPTFNELLLVFDPTADYAFVEAGLDDDELTNTMRLLHGGPSPQARLKSHVSDDAPDLEETTIRQVAYSLKTWLSDQGYSVSSIYIPPPGEHPNGDQMQTLLFLLEAFGGLALILGGLLVATMMSTLLSQQILQIGVMKAIGGRTRQIAGIYLMMVLTLGFIGLLIGIPLGLMAGGALARGVADILNLNINDASLPHWVYMVQIVAGLFIPTLATVYPIYRGSRISVQAAISDYGVNQRSLGSRLIDRLLARLQGIGRTTLLSIRGAFRRQGRLLSTLLTLAFGGAAFMVALNVSASWANTIETSFDRRSYDLSMTFAAPYSPESIDAALENVPAVTAWEGWGEATATLVYPDGTNSNEFMLLAPPADTGLVDFEVREGRWLQTSDTDAVVINHTLSDVESDLAVGDNVTLAADGRQASFRIVGVVQEVGVPPTVYLNYPAYTTWMETEGSIQYAQIALNRHDEDSQQAIARQVEGAFDAAGLRVETTRMSATTRQILLDHIVVLQMVLLMMAVLVVAVGGLGLASTMSMNILERTREIGVMRSIGASDTAILKILLSEGLFIGVLSWGLAVLLSIPLTILIGNVAGQIFVRANLDMVYAPLGVGAWLLIVIVISAIASALPALKATELPVYEVLAYE